MPAGEGAYYEPDSRIVCIRRSSVYSKCYIHIFVTDCSTTMDLQDILAIRKWASLESTVCGIDTSAFEGRSLYRVSSTLFLSLSKVRIDHASAAVGPYVTGVLWAPDRSAARRAMDLAIEEDLGIQASPPTEMLPPHSSSEYVEILAGLKKMGAKVCQETASYRIAIDGIFVHRSIETERYTFYFRSPKDDRYEQPFAILCKLPT